MALQRVDEGAEFVDTAFVVKSRMQSEKPDRYSLMKPFLRAVLLILSYQVSMGISA